MLTHDDGDQGEDADRGVVHHDVRHADHDVADGIKEVRHAAALFTEPVEAEAEHDGKEDDLQDGALRERFHRVHRHDVEKRAHKARRLDAGGFETFRGEREADARINEVGDEETEDHGDGGRCHEAKERLDGNTAQLGDVGNTGGTGNQGRKYQRYDDHTNEANEEIAQRLQVSHRKIGTYEHTYYDAECQTQHHLHRQAQKMRLLCCHSIFS